MGASNKKILLVLSSILLSVILLTMLTASGFIFWLFDFDSSQLHIDTCVEMGGHWDFLLNQCLD